MKSCSVETCEEKDIPLGLKGDVELNKYTRDAQFIQGCGDKQDLGFLNTSISEKVHEELQKWSDYDDAQDDFCILDDNQDDLEFVDLQLNPERYTGYRGESATRVWKSIYLENCFKSQNPATRKSYSPIIPYRDMSALNGVCLEERVFYRMVSGLHSSINIHLCANYLLSEKASHIAFAPPAGVWGANIEEFKTRFSPESTDNEGSTWLRNLYFAYIVELRALAKIAPYLRNEEYYTGFEQEDKEVQMAIRDLLNVIESFPTHFNESLMFNGSSSKLKNEFREKFRNISKIMDCVGCDKCRLWGKLQVQGMGTALKILFSGKFDQDKLDNTMFESRLNKNQFKLRRTEIVSLLNAFGRLSNSIYHLELFRSQLRR